MQLSKYSASGNDFIIFHTFLKKDRSSLAKKLCDRHEGFGADGLIVLLPHDKYDFEWQFYNADGSEANMCGNGSRACAHYAYHNGLTNANISFLTKAGVIKAKVQKNIVTSQLTKPICLTKPFIHHGLKWYFYDTGVPHLVSFVDDLNHSWNKKTIQELRHKYNANVNLAKITDILEVRTFERGVEDETLACGTGMAACFFAAFKNGLILDEISVKPKSKQMLKLGFHKDKITLQGKVKFIYSVNY